MLGAPTSLAGIMVIGPHHAAATHVGGSSEVGQREHMARQGFSRKCWSEFLCLGGYALGRRPSADSRRWRTAGGPVAGAQLGIFGFDFAHPPPCDHKVPGLAFGAAGLEKIGP
jgi:hypothetical protein